MNQIPKRPSPHEVRQRLEGEISAYMDKANDAARARHRLNIHYAESMVGEASERMRAGSVLRLDLDLKEIEATVAEMRVEVTMADLLPDDASESWQRRSA